MSTTTSALQTTYPWRKRNRNPPMNDDKLYTSLSANTVMAKLTNHVQRTRLITSLTDKHYSLDSEDDLCSGCQNVSHQQQFFSELPSPRRLHNMNYWYSWVQTIYYLNQLFNITIWDDSNGYNYIWHIFDNWTKPKITGVTLPLNEITKWSTVTWNTRTQHRRTYKYMTLYLLWDVNELGDYWNKMSPPNVSPVGRNVQI